MSRTDSKDRHNDKFGHSGPAVDLMKEFGLSAENIIRKVKKSFLLSDKYKMPYII